MTELNEAYWERRYDENQTGWDIGHISQPLKAYFDQLQNKDLRILVPGAGNAYEAEYLWKNDFKQTFVLDFSKKAIDNFLNRVNDFPAEQLIQSDFFKHFDQYDLIVEQTFFCAIDPIKRQDLVDHAYNMLNAHGKHVGLLFDFPLESGPPFGGSASEYRSYFSERYTDFKLEKCYNSIPPRKDREFFFIAKKN